nr:hypothetical protein [Tanacetum cinerariifolium]
MTVVVVGVMVTGGVDVGGGDVAVAAWCDVDVYVMVCGVEVDRWIGVVEMILVGDEGRRRVAGDLAGKRWRRRQKL